MSGDEKAAGAYRTIGEVAETTGVAPHVLRYWETRFPQLRPLTRAGNRRYYNPADVALVGRIHRLLGTEGYKVKGVQKLLAIETPVAEALAFDDPSAALTAIRDRLQRALDAA